MDLETEHGKAAKSAKPKAFDQTQSQKSPHVFIPSKMLNSKSNEEPQDSSFAKSLSPNKRKRKRPEPEPEEKSPSKRRILMPKSLFTPTTSNYEPLPKVSKKKVYSMSTNDSKHTVRPILKKKVYSMSTNDSKHTVRPIIPKSSLFGVGPKNSSPTKAAALLLKKKATLVCRRSPVKLLSKNPEADLESVEMPALSRILTRSQGNKGKTTDSESIRDEEVASKSNQKAPHEDADDAELSQGEDVEDADKGDAMYLNDLMAACTTISYDLKKNGTAGDGDVKSRNHQKRRNQICLSMLEKDILESDPKKAERDLLHAKGYLDRVKLALRREPEKLRQFLTILHVLDRDGGDPVVAYGELSSLLVDQPELVEDFAGFLQPHQAVECDCLLPHLQYHQLREMLRRIEIFCESSANQYQRAMKVLAKWSAMDPSALKTGPTVKEKLLNVLKNLPNFLEESLDFFLDVQAPQSRPDDFEELDFRSESGELTSIDRLDEFEEIVLPKGPETYNNKICACHCHVDTDNEMFHKRTKHCFSCSLWLDNGRLVMKPTKNKVIPFLVTLPPEKQANVIQATPNKQSEKFKRAKRNAALLALARAKAQRSGGKKDNSILNTSNDAESSLLQEQNVRRAKRNAALLVLAKAKAQRSGDKKNKASNNGANERRTALQHKHIEVQKAIEIEAGRQAQGKVRLQRSLSKGARSSVYDPAQESYDKHADKLKTLKMNFTVDAATPDTTKSTMAKVRSQRLQGKRGKITNPHITDGPINQGEYLTQQKSNETVGTCATSVQSVAGETNITLQAEMCTQQTKTKARKTGGKRSKGTNISQVAVSDHSALQAKGNADDPSSSCVTPENRASALTYSLVTDNNKNMSDLFEASVSETSNIILKIRRASLPASFDPQPSQISDAIAVCGPHLSSVSSSDSSTSSETSSESSEWSTTSTSSSL